MNGFISMNRGGEFLSNEARRLQEQVTICKYSMNNMRLGSLAERDELRKDVSILFDMLIKSDRVPISTIQKVKDELRQSIHSVFDELQQETGVIDVREFEFAAADGIVAPIEKRKKMSLDL
jgi:hypothetical protein